MSLCVPMGSLCVPMGWLRVAMGWLWGCAVWRQFGAVQFSDRPEAVFSLRDYAERPQPRALLRDVRQQRGLTDTFTAIAYVAYAPPPVT